MSASGDHDTLIRLLRTRVHHPERIAEAAATRRRPERLVGESGRLMLVAADHPARGGLRAGNRPHAMADRVELLHRLQVALVRPGVDGVLGTADVLEDLLLLGALEGKVVIGSMNRGGLTGTAFEIDDRFTAYDAAGIAGTGFQGGKMLLRIDARDAATAPTLQACSQAVDALAERRLMAMVEPFLSTRSDGAGSRVVNQLDTDSVVRSVTVAAGLGRTSAHTWLKLPVVEGMDEVLAATTLPVLLLGGEVVDDQGAQFAAWQKVLASPSVVGLVVGRSLLYPPDDDVARAVDTCVEML